MVTLVLEPGDELDRCVRSAGLFTGDGVFREVRDVWDVSESWESREFCDEWLGCELTGGRRVCASEVGGWAWAVERDLSGEGNSIGGSVDGEVAKGDMTRCGYRP